MKIKYFLLVVFLLGIVLFGATVTWADSTSLSSVPVEVEQVTDTVSVPKVDDLGALPVQQDSDCVTCHVDLSPGLVDQYKESMHASAEEVVDCKDCHGEDHTGEDDAAMAKMPTQGTCGKCHSDQVDQFKKGKHDLAWAAMNAIPMTHNQPIGISVGQKGCGSCHKIGAKSDEDKAVFEEVGQHYGISGCDSCHTRHAFSAAEARRPEACSNCHMGFDHPQWEMYNSSKHGVIYQVEGDTWDWETSLKDGASYRSPTCQYCHMSEGDHEVITSWGFLGLRVEEPDEEWAATRATILKGVGALNADGTPGPLFEAVGALRLARLTMDDWQKPRDEMIGVCSHCHGETFVRQNLEASDELLKESDIVFAQSIETIKDLYEDGVLTEAEDAVYISPPYPFLLSFYDAPYVIEQDLYLQWMEYRQRAFQGAFHNSADFMHWYGWAPLNETAVRIEDEAQKLRAEAK